VIVTVACVALVAAIASATIYYYNQYKACLVWLDHDKAIWDNELQRRASLLPNLILVSAKYSEHEKVLFEYVTKMRGSLGKGNGEPSSDAPDSPLNKLMSSLLAVSEQYPDLKATQSFEQLMKEWAETENRVAEARASYIKRIRTLNDLYAKFPSNIFGRLFFVANRHQWTLDASMAADKDVDKTYQNSLVEQAEVKSERPVESKSASVPERLAAPDPASTPDQQKPVSSESQSQ
jgi:LemA protein